MQPHSISEPVRAEPVVVRDTPKAGTPQPSSENVVKKRNLSLKTLARCLMLRIAPVVKVVKCSRINKMIVVIFPSFACAVAVWKA